MSNPLPSIRLDRLRLQNFRCFREIEITFDPQLTVIVAPNGGGKTAILDSVAICWRLFVDTMLTKAGSTGFDHSDIRLDLSPSQTMEPLLPTSLTASGFLEPDNDSVLDFSLPKEWTRQLNSNQPRAKTSIAEAAVLKQFAERLREELQNEVTSKGGKSPIFPLVAYYGTGRLFGVHKLTQRKKEQANRPTSRYNGYEDCLTSSSRYKFFVDWFERFSRDAQDESTSGKKSHHQPQLKLHAVKSAVDFVLRPSGWHDLRWDFAQGLITADHATHGCLPVDALSDGVRNMIGLVADIAHRAVRLNPQFGADAAKLTPGVVLIDEVDMHLHPEWQQLVLGALQDAFPCIQFIVTTHSPQVLTTVKRENIRILGKNQLGEWEALLPPQEIKGVDSAVALNDVMNVNPIPPVKEAQWLADYTAKIETGSHENEEGSTLRDKLLALYGPTHPVILDIDRLIRFQAFKLRKDSQPKG